MANIIDKFRLDGKVALVTGGAYGIGFAIADALAQAGAKIAFNCRGQKHLDQALADYAERDIDARGYIADVTDEEQVAKLVADIAAWLDENGIRYEIVQFHFKGPKNVGILTGGTR